MLGQSIWWGSIVIEVLLLARGLRVRLVSRYPAFYSYVAFVLLQDLACFVVYRRGGTSSPLYSYCYWTTEFLCVLAGCALFFEAYRVVLSSYPGTARMARNALGLVFALALAKDIASACADPRWWLGDPFYIERALRVTQAAAILALVALFLLYAIPFGKNSRGILLGYGSFVAVRLVSLAFAHGAAQDFWYYAYSASYLLALGIWATHLWSYSESTVPTPQTARLENDYQALAAATRHRLQTARGQLARAVRS